MRTLAAAVIFVSALAGGRPARAADHVHYLGLISPDTPNRELSGYEATVDELLAGQVDGYTNRLETLRALGTDTELGALRKRARQDYASATAAAQRLEMQTAIQLFSQAEAGFRDSYTEWLDPAALTRLLQERAMVHYAQRDQDAMAAVLGRAMLTHATKKLDAGRFPPEVLEAWNQIAAQVVEQPVLTPGRLSTLARREKVPFFVAGELRGGLLTLHAVTGGRGWTERATVSSPRDPAIAEAVDRLVERAGLPRVIVVSGEPTPTPTPDDARPLFRRWYFWAGVATLVASATGAGIAASNSGGGGGGPTPQPTPTPGNPDDGVTVIFNLP